VTKNQALPILIAGGGIGGLTAALALGRRGYRVCLIEQAREFKEIGAGIQLGPNVFKMFDRLGIRDEISSTAVFPESLLVMDSITAEEVTRIPLGEKFRDRFRYPYALIHRADIHAVLLQACRSSPMITLVTSQKVVRFEDRGDKVVAYTEDGTSFEGAALIGADGLWSTIRATVVGDGPPRVSGHIAYRAVLATEEVPLHLRIPSMTGPAITWSTILYAEVNFSIWWPCSIATVIGKVGTPLAILTSSRGGFRTSSRMYRPCSAKLNRGACGFCATVSLSRIGARVE
jgi:2-polyprenyl-6-methoxyphenol hydroxylase-like FAD-dependent oxidoreductase